LRGKSQPYREDDTRKQHFHDHLSFFLGMHNLTTLSFVL
jgi:hypothetical protein